MGLVDGALPVRWKPGPKSLRWKTKIPGKGSSSPIAVGGRFIVTAAEADGESAVRSVYAVDAETGGIVWQTEVVSAPAGSIHAINTFAAPTPVTDGRHVFVFFGSHLASLDLDGKLVWVREVDPLYAEGTRYGTASSPALFGDTVVVLKDREAAGDEVGFYAAYAKRDGEELWRHEWTKDEGPCCSYTTPLVLTEADGQRRLIVARSGGVLELDPETGEELWMREYAINQIVSSPVYENGLLVVSGGAHGVRATVSYRLPPGRGSAPEELWHKAGAAPNSSSPLLVDGRIYFVTDLGVLSTYVAETGDLVWRGRVGKGRYNPSLLWADGLIYVTDQLRMSTAVVRDLGKSHEIVSENLLGEAGAASGAAAYGCLVQRGYSNLYCVVGLPEKGAKKAAGGKKAGGKKGKATGKAPAGDPEEGEES